VTPVPYIRGFKIAENQSPRPQDRFFFSYNHYDNLNGSINRRLGGVVSNLRVDREIFGYEKTFFDRRASLGIRLPLDTLQVKSTRFPQLSRKSTALGNLGIFGKFVLYQDTTTGSLLSAGMLLTPPTAGTKFAGYPNIPGFRTTTFQPFIGYIWNRDRFYLQGFSAIEVPTDDRDVTLLYNDIGMGYFVYRAQDPDAFLQAIAPTFEVHVNTPLNHRGAGRVSDPSGTPDVVDLTYGVSAMVGKGSLFSVGFVTPVTGPRPFDLEVLVQFSYYFGRSRRNQTPPIIGG
jgi:hypothetical protein